MSLLFCLDHVRAHASTKGAPSAGVETLDNDDSYDEDVTSVGYQTPREQPNLTTGVASRRLRAGPLARRHKGERHHYSSALTAKGARSHQRGGQRRRINSVNKDDSYDDKGNNVVSVRHLKTVRDPNDSANWASNGPPKTRST